MIKLHFCALVYARLSISPSLARAAWRLQITFIGRFPAIRALQLRAVASSRLRYIGVLHLIIGYRLNHVFDLVLQKIHADINDVVRDMYIW